MAMKTKLDTRNTTNFKFEKIGHKLQGYYVGTFDEVINGRDVKKHVFKTAIGLESVLGQTHLSQLLGGVNPGTMIVATFVGTKKTKQPQPMKLFELQYDDEDTIDASAVVSASAPSEEAAGEPEYSDTGVDGTEGGEEYQEEQPQEEPAEEPAPAPAPVKRAAAPAQRPAAPAQKPPVSRPAAGPISEAAKARAAALMPRK